MPRPVISVAVSVPKLASVSPASSTVTVSAPLPPWSVSRAQIASTVRRPPTTGAPTMIASSPEPVNTVSGAKIEGTYTVSPPSPVSSVVEEPA